MEPYYYASPSSSSAQTMNKYWIPHKDIHKKVIMTHIQSYLGRDATVRSYTKDGEDGFLITTPGDCLTDEQIDDLCMKSLEMWERQAAARSSDSSPKALKRPLHQPVVIARAGSRSGSYAPSNDGRGRRPSHRSSHHSGRHHNHHYPNQQQHQQQQQQQPQQRYPQQQQQHYNYDHHQRSNSDAQAHSYHTSWEPMSPAQDNTTLDGGRQY